MSRETHRSVLPECIEANPGCEVSQRLAGPPPLLEHVQHRLQCLLYVLQKQCIRVIHLQRTPRDGPLPCLHMSALGPEMDMRMCKRLYRAVHAGLDLC